MERQSSGLGLAERGGTRLRSLKFLSWKKVLLLLPQVAGPGSPGLTFSRVGKPLDGFRGSDFE